MTNKEKFRDILEILALANVIWGLDKNGTPVPEYLNSCIRFLTEKE